MISRVSRLSLSYYKRRSTQDQLEADSSKEDTSSEDTSLEGETEVYSGPLNLEKESKLVQLMLQSSYQTEKKKEEPISEENASHDGDQQDNFKIKSAKIKATLAVSKPETSRGSPSSGSSSTEFKKEKLGFLSVKDESGRFPCLWCERAYTTEYNLRRHCLKHKEEKHKQMFHCPECWRKFDRRDMLGKHSLAHKNDRPHVCGLCRRRFKHKCHLNNHIKLERCFKRDNAKYY